MENLEKMFHPRSIAIIGASEKIGKVGNVITENVLKLGYAGEIYLINPSHVKLFEKKCYPSLEALENEVDLAIIAVPARFVIETITKGAEKCQNFVVVSAGFSEIGNEGLIREKELKNLATEKGLNILGPNCLGFIAPELKLNASFAGGMPSAGNIAFLSQSGALAVALMDMAGRENLGFSNIISIGNKMKLNENSLLEYFANDEKTKVIGMYLEGIADGEKFLQTAQKVSTKKPIVILKSGKTEKSQRAISSHTGSLAGSDAVMDSLFKKAGVIRAKNLTEFFNLIRLVSFSNEMNENGVAVVTNAGGVGVLTTDLFLDKNISLAEFSSETKSSLQSFLPEESSVENPVDVLGDAHENRYQKVLEDLKDKNIGAYIVILTPQNQTPIIKIAETLSAFREKTGAVIVAVFVGGEKVEEGKKLLEKNNIPCFLYPEEAVNALNDYYTWSQNKNNLFTLKVSIAFDSERAAKTKSIIKKAKKEGRSALYFKEAEEIFATYGIQTVPTFDLTEKQAREITYPLAVKVDSDKVLHKTEKQGVILGVENENELKEILEKMRVNFPGEKIIGQLMQKASHEIILGIKRDESAGTVAVFGFGGIYAEIFKKVDFLIYPCTIAEIEKIVMESQIGFLFRETRGKITTDIHHFSKIISGLMTLANEAEEILELDVNPLFLYNYDRPPLAADIKIIF